MATFLFDKVVFGPVISRRLGVSLGINLLPTDRKICSFDCLYCECGLNAERKGNGKLPSFTDFSKALEDKLKSMLEENQLPDVITFAGNGEPTMHPDFLAIIKETIRLRDIYCSGAKITVLSNSTRLFKADVLAGLQLVDMNILKLDSAIEETVKVLNRNEARYNLKDTIQQLSDFPGEVIIQTLFCRGDYKGKKFDNTTDEELEAWLVALSKIKPASVMVYSLSRDTPIDSIQAVEKDELERIAKKVREIGLKVEIS